MSENKTGAPVPEVLFSPADKIELIVTHPFFWTGGATDFCNNLVRERLRTGLALLVVSPFVTSDYRVMFRIDAWRGPESCRSVGALDLSAVLRRYLPQIVSIRVNNFHGLSYLSPTGRFDLSIYQQMTSLVLQVKRARKCGLTYYFHDFLSVCPFVFCVSDRMEYCNPGPDTALCRECVKHSHPWTMEADPELDVAAWRQCSRTFLDECTELIFFSRATANLLEKILPGIVAEHPERLRIQEQQSEETVFPPVIPSQQAKMVIGVIGDINVVKGAKQVADLYRYIRAERPEAEMVVIGELHRPFIDSVPGLAVTGHYENRDLPDLIRKHGINVLYFSSICPESFSRVISEIRMMELPVALYPLGAPWERLCFSERASAIPDFTPEAAYRTLEALFHRFRAGEKSAVPAGAE